MTVYRFYFISNRKSIVGVPARHACADDASALIHAGDLAAKAPSRAAALEVWETRRLVGRVPVVPAKSEVPVIKAS
jgi:hypothetical protein